MILYDRMSSPYIRELACKTVKIENSNLNVLVSESASSEYVVTSVHNTLESCGYMMLDGKKYVVFLRDEY